jgi:uncharacterized membrane protein YhfC
MTPEERAALREKQMADREQRMAQREKLVAAREKRIAARSNPHPAAFQIDRRLLIPGIILVVLLVLWAVGDRNFPLTRLLSVGLHAFM